MQAEPRPEYQSIRISRPLAGSHVRELGEGLEVAVELWPNLKTKRGHLLQLLLDGQPKGDAEAATTRRLLDVGRGQHTIAARVVKKGEVIIESRPVSFFYRRPQSFISAPRLYPSTAPVRAAPWAPMAPKAQRAPNVPARPGSR